MKNYLLTGSTGFVGKKITQNLLEKGISLNVVTRRSNSSSLNEFPGIKNIFFTDNLFLESKDWWREVCEDIDVVIHAAWYTNHEDYLHSPRNLECLNGSINLAIGAAEANIKKFIGIGTCFEYAPSVDPLTVESYLKPFTLYGAAKAGLYLTLSKFFEDKSLPFAWARLFYLYGDGENKSKLTSFIRQNLEDNKKVKILNGREIRDYMDVAIAGRIISTLALSEQVGVFNVCSGNPVTIKEHSLKIASELGKAHLIEFLDSSDVNLNMSCILGVPNVFNKDLNYDSR